MEQKHASKAFRYRVRTAWISARRGTLSAAGRPDVVVGSPPEFRGDADNWAPEELLVGSVNTCMMLTFLTLAERRGVRIVNFESDAEGVLEKVDGFYRVTRVTVRPRVTLAEAELEPARQAMDSVETHCFMSNSIKAEVTLVPEFAVAPVSPE